MSVETAPTANSAIVKKEETPKAELKHCRKALVDRNTRWCCCTLTCAALPTGRLLATAAEPPGKAQTGFTERRIENEPGDRYGRV